MSEPLLPPSGRFCSSLQNQFEQRFKSCEPAAGLAAVVRGLMLLRPSHGPSPGPSPAQRPRALGHAGGFCSERGGLLPSPAAATTSAQSVAVPRGSCSLGCLGSGAETRKKRRKKTTKKTSCWKPSQTSHLLFTSTFWCMGPRQGVLHPDGPEVHGPALRWQGQSCCQPGPTSRPTWWWQGQRFVMASSLR